MALPVGSCTRWDGGDGEWEICNDNGFVYRCRGLRRVSDDNDPLLRSPPPTDRRRSRKKKTLLSVRDKYRKGLDQWEQLSASLAQITAAGPTGPLPDAPPPPPPLPEPPASTDIDELLLQVEVQESMLGKPSELCDYVDAVLDAEEERTAEALTDLPVWGSPRCLVAALTSV